MSKPFRTAALSVALLASSIALAQTAPPQPGQTPSVGKPMQPHWRSPRAEQVRASTLIGASVRNSAGETIGDINEVVLGKDGKVEAVVIGVGGFLGLGERQVAVSFESLRFTPGNGAMTPTLEATKEILESAPEWRWSAEERSKPNR
jgi:sporulation protein YlmC with PRC-barrel domain